MSVRAYAICGSTLRLPGYIKELKDAFLNHMIETSQRQDVMLMCHFNYLDTYSKSLNNFRI